MKYVEMLSEVEEHTLTELMKNHCNARARARAYAVLLSNHRFKVNEIGRIYAIDRDTASQWLRDWKMYGLVVLYDEPRSGRPPKLSMEEKEKLIFLIKEALPRSM